MKEKKEPSTEGGSFWESSILEFIEYHEMRIWSICEEHGGPEDPSVILHATQKHTWSILRYILSILQGLVSLPACYFDTWYNHFSLLCYIWRLNLVHVASGSVQYSDTCYNRANRYKNVRMTWQAFWVFLPGQ